MTESERLALMFDADNIYTALTTLMDSLQKAHDRIDRLTAVLRNHGIRGV